MTHVSLPVPRSARLYTVLTVLGPDLAAENLICLLDPAVGRAPPTVLNPEAHARRM